MDELKKGFEEVAGDEAKEMAAAVGTEESKGKQSDFSIKGDMSYSSKVIGKDEKKVNMLSQLKKKNEEEKKANKNV